MKLYVVAMGLVVSSVAVAQQRAQILSDNGAYHRVYVKDGGKNLVFGMDARIGVAGVIGRKRPQFLRMHFADGSSIKYARLMRGGKVDVKRRMAANARELARVFTAMGRPRLAQALRALPKEPMTGGPYLAAGVSFGGIWKDPGVGITLPSGDRLSFSMMGEGTRKPGQGNALMGRPRLRLRYALARAGGGVESHQVVLHGTTGSTRQQANNARKLNQALDFLEGHLVSAVQP